MKAIMQRKQSPESINNGPHNSNASKISNVIKSVTHRNNGLHKSLTCKIKNVMKSITNENSEPLVALVID